MQKLMIGAAATAAAGAAAATAAVTVGHRFFLVSWNDPFYQKVFGHMEKMSKKEEMEILKEKRKKSVAWAKMWSNVWWKDLCLKVVCGTMLHIA